MKRILITVLIAFAGVAVNAAPEGKSADKKSAQTAKKISLAEARGSIDRAVENPNKMTELMKGLSAENISVYSMPGTDKMLHNLSFWINDEEQVYTMLEEIYGLTKPETEEGENSEEQGEQKEGQ